MAENELRKDAVETAQTAIEAMSIQGGKDSAEADLEKYNKAIIDSANSPTAQLLASRANAFYRLEKYEDAIKDCEAATAKDPKCLLALQTCGRSFLALEEYGSAIAELRDAQAVSYDESIANNLSNIYKKLNQKKLEHVNFSEKQKGWQGPGERNTKNRVKKNKKIIKKATYGTQNEKEWLDEKWMSTEYIPNASNQSKVLELGYGYATRILRKYDNGFLKKAEKLQNLFNKFLQILDAGTNEEKIKFVRKIEKAGDELHNEIINVLKLQGIHDIALIPCYLPNIIANKCLARYYCAQSIGPEPMVPCKKETYPIAYELLQAAIKDADECIRLLYFPEYKVSISPPGEENPILAMSARQNRPQMNLMLIARGGSYQYLEKYELAMNDFRALCSRKRMDSPQSWNQEPTLHDATRECLNTATLIKLRDKVPRPHYTKKELEKFEKEVGLGLYSAEKYFCGFCNVKESNKVMLRLCSRCNNVWFCSQECLKKAWKTGHKAMCKPIMRHCCLGFQISMEHIQGIMECLEETGFCCVELKDTCWIICQEDGKFFDSLSNRELHFQKMKGGYVLRTNCCEG